MKLDELLNPTVCVCGCPKDSHALEYTMPFGLFRRIGAPRVLRGQCKDCDDCLSYEEKA